MTPEFISFAGFMIPQAICIAIVLKGRAGE